MRPRVCVTVLVIVVASLAASAGAQPDPIARAKQAVDASPNDPALWVKLAELLVQEQHIAEAIDAYQGAIKLDTTATAPKLALASLHLRTAEPRRAALMLRDVAVTATDDDLVARAGSEAIALEEMLGTLGELAQALLPVANTPARRRLLVDTYVREVSRLDARARGDKAAAAAAATELARIGTAALAPLVAALRDPDLAVQRDAITVLGRTGNPAAAPALVKRAAPPKAAAPSKSTAPIPVTGSPPLDARNLRERAGIVPNATAPSKGTVQIQSPTLPPLDERDVRVAALVAAGRLASPAVLDDVLPLMQDPDVGMREAATFALARTGDRRAVPPLVAALDDRRTSIATLACLGLARQRDRRVGPALFAVVGDARRLAVVRGACAYAIGVQRLAAGVPALTRALEADSEALRLAAWSLGEIAQPATLAPLIDAYFAHAGQDRRELAFAIARTSGTPATSPPVASNPPPDRAEFPRTNDRFDAAQAVAALPGNLAELTISDSVLRAHAADVGQAVANALTSPELGLVLRMLAELDGVADRLGFGALTPRSLDPAAEAATATIAAAIEPTLTALLAHSDPRIRARALSPLVKAIGPRTEGAIATALSDQDAGVRAAAMSAIAQLGQRNAVPPALLWRLGRALGTGTWQDRSAAARAMGELRGAADVGALIVAAGDSSVFVREAVASALGAIRTSATVEPLLQLSRDEVAAVRAAAGRSLRTIGDPRARKRVRELRADPDPVVRGAINN